MSLIGARELHKDNPHLITARGQFVDDIAPAASVVMGSSDFSWHGRVPIDVVMECCRAPSRAWSPPPL